MGELIGWTLLAGSVATLPWYVKGFHQHMMDGDEGTSAKVLSIAWALCSSWTWPLLIPGYWLWIHCFGKEDKTNG